MKVLLIGAMGQVGWELNRTLQPLGDVIAMDYPIIDLASKEQICGQVSRILPDLIVNAAAYTAVDKAEEEPELAMSINGKAPGILAGEAKRIGAVLIHYSTDYVFDGSKGTPYTEDDPPNPINTYGETKLEGEEAIRRVDIPYLILRTSWVYGVRGKNFMRTILRLAREKNEIRIVNDQIASPNWCRMIAEATAQILAQGISDLPGFFSQRGGIYHLSAQGQTSWFGFAKAILELDPNKKEHRFKQLIPVSTNEYPTTARRPAYSFLSSQSAKKIFGLRIPEWKSTLGQALSEEILITR